MVHEGVIPAVLVGAALAFTYAVWISYRIYLATRSDSDIWFHVFFATVFASMMTYGHLLNKLCGMAGCGFDVADVLVPLDVTTILVASVFAFIGAVRIKQETEHRQYM